MTNDRFVQLTQRHAIRALFAILIGAGLIFGVVGLIQQRWTILAIAGAGLLIDMAVLIAYLRGWRYALVTLAFLMTAFVNMALQTGATSESGLYWALLPVVLALILTNTLWTALAAAVTLAVQLLGPLSGPTYRQPEVLVGYLVITVGLLVSRLILEGALASASQSAAQAREEAERATAALALAEQRAAELTQRSATQQQLLDTIATLETPAIAFSEGVLLAPLVGYIDAPRAQRLLSNLLQSAHEGRARHVILDITGVPLVDDAALDILIQIVQALRLLGCAVTISGIRAAIAGFLAGRPNAFVGVRVVANLQQALQQA